MSAEKISPFVNPSAPTPPPLQSVRAAAAPAQEPRNGLAPPVRVETDAATLDAAVERINAVLQDFRRDLVFSVDEPTGRTIVQVVEPSSGEVLRQIPTPEVLKMAARLQENASLDSLGEDRWI